MKKLLYIFFFVLLCFLGHSQTKEELESKKRENYNNIKFTNELLEKTASNKKSNYNQLILLDSKIKNREELIVNINNEINLLDNSIDIHLDAIKNLEADLLKLKQEYAKMIYYSYLHRNNYDKIMFILASDDFNMAYKRLKYLQQYNEYRRLQAQKIVETSNQLNNELIQLESLKGNKRDALFEKQNENKTLISEKESKNIALKELQKQEKDLKIKLKKQYEIADALQKEIEKIIEEEARKAAEKVAGKSSDYFNLTPEEKLIAENITKNKNRLPWPTQRGIITSSFGEHPHPVIKGVVIRNDGVDISTTEGAAVRSVFDGVVKRVFVISGAHKNVLIQHGDYFTLYSNLEDVIVKVGDKVTAKQTIGTIYTDKENENKSVLQFQIWYQFDKLNPEEWLAKGKNG